jgi:hypothetical protein
MARARHETAREELAHETGTALLATTAHPKAG